jgi:hypothetical protein
VKRLAAIDRLGEAVDAGGVRGRCECALERAHHVLRAHGRAVVKARALSQVERPRAPYLVEGVRRGGDRREVGVEAHESLEDLRGDLLLGERCHECRVERRRVREQRHRQRPAASAAFDRHAVPLAGHVRGALAQRGDRVAGPLDFESVGGDAVRAVQHDAGALARAVVGAPGDIDVRAIGVEDRHPIGRGLGDGCEEKERDRGVPHQEARAEMSGCTGCGMASCW